MCYAYETLFSIGQRSAAIFSLSSFHVKAQEIVFPTFLTHVTVFSHVTVCAQMAAKGGRHLASVTRCKTAKAVVKPLICVSHGAYSLSIWTEIVC